MALKIGPVQFAVEELERIKKVLAIRSGKSFACGYYTGWVILTQITPARVGEGIIVRIVRDIGHECTPDAGSTILLIGGTHVHPNPWSALAAAFLSFP
jgi:hypothetical protein